MKNEQAPADHLLSTPVTSDSADYEHTFYGILNKQGEFWTPLPFHDEGAARKHLERYARGSNAGMLNTHTIVPVLVRLEVLPASSAPSSRNDLSGVAL